MALKWGQARIEANALRDEILAMIRAGWTVGNIYKALHDAGRITMSRKVFFPHVARLKSETVSDPAPTTTAQTGGISNPPAPKEAHSPVPAKPAPNEHFRRLEHPSDLDVDAFFNDPGPVEPLGKNGGQK